VQADARATHLPSDGCLLHAVPLFSAFAKNSPGQGTIFPLPCLLIFFSLRAAAVVFPHLLFLGIIPVQRTGFSAVSP
jgi:hypothetical protein